MSETSQSGPGRIIEIRRDLASLKERRKNINFAIGALEKELSVLLKRADNFFKKEVEKVF